MRRLPVGLVVLLLLFASCGDDATVDTSTTTTFLAATTTSSSIPIGTTTTTTSSTTMTTTVPPPPPSEWKISTVGLGPIRVGSTVEDAAAAAGVTLSGELEPLVSESCYFVVPEGIDGVIFLVLDDRIAFTHVSTPDFTTSSGAVVGMTEDELKTLFPDNLVEGNEFTFDGTALVYVPTDEDDLEYRVVFETDGGAVTGIRAGILPGVAFIEGCL